VKLFPEGPPAFSLARLWLQWEAQRLRPEHQGEKASVFYVWRVITILCAVVGCIPAMFGIPALIASTVGPHLPPLSDTALGISMFLLILVGFGAGWLASIAISHGLRYIELHISVPACNSGPLIPK